MKLDSSTQHNLTFSRVIRGDGGFVDVQLVNRG